MSMDKVSFQNGFICGMATKGLVRSGELYKPKIWNDEGVYDYFYIDFRRAMQEFSTGMFNESLVIHDSEQIKATAVEYISSGVCKVRCDISNRPHGITVLNKKTSRLRFATGERLPVFSVHMFIAGQPAYIDAGYLYDRLVLPSATDTTTDGLALTLWGVDDVVFSETSNLPAFALTGADNPSITLI